ncbi:unnamed protein product [Tenebrio molitor]|nr:unnamed protein product [Tenebrio molitor]
MCISARCFIMVKMIKTVLILLVVSQCNSQKAPSSCPNPAGGLIQVGAAVTLPGCKLVLCSNRGLHSIPCPIVHTDDSNCFNVLGNESEPWPNCCPTIDCN